VWPEWCHQYVRKPNIAKAFIQKRWRVAFAPRRTARGYASRLLVLFSLVFCDFFDGIPGSAPGMVPQLRLTATDHLLVDLDVSSQLWRASIHSGHFTH
jgi:hypothetical protein